MVDFIQWLTKTEGGTPDGSEMLLARVHVQREVKKRELEKELKKRELQREVKNRTENFTKRKERELQREGLASEQHVSSQQFRKITEVPRRARI